MPAIRINITLPEDLLGTLKKVVKSGETSSFIANLIREKLWEIQKEKRNMELAEGYKKRREEDLKIAKKFEHLDVEGLDEY